MMKVKMGIGEMRRKDYVCRKIPTAIVLG